LIVFKNFGSVNTDVIAYSATYKLCILELI
jgi:hypothetical protein